jgi:DNA-binding transcriptional regulator YdaS (Cro superfamily)
MSHLSLAINDALTSLAKTQTAFADRASLHPTQISKASKGKRVGAAVIHAIARALPAEHRGAVAAAWLKDQLKPDVLATVDVFSAGSRGAEQPNYQLPPELDADTRDLILWLAQQATRHTAVRDALHSLRRAAEAVTS